uniref:Uncharacterized protein n=1 Tax=Amphimedon queenslandica TaxID=400682 RepID=A0A1X7T301_AMPQE
LVANTNLNCQYLTIQTISESKRIYQGIKFIVGLANRCSASRPEISFLLKENNYKWQSRGCGGKLMIIFGLMRLLSHSLMNPRLAKYSKGQLCCIESLSSFMDTLDEANALLNELEARDSRAPNPSLTTTSTTSSSSSFKSSRESGNTPGGNIEG